MAASSRSAEAAKRPITTATIEASGPKTPPDQSGGPEIVFAIRPWDARPDTAAARAPPSVKFHPKWRPIGSHSVRDAAYAAPSIAPASSAIAVELHHVAPWLSAWTRPNNEDETTIAAIVPKPSSKMRK